METTDSLLEGMGCSRIVRPGPSGSFFENRVRGEGAGNLSQNESMEVVWEVPNATTPPYISVAPFSEKSLSVL